VTSIWRTLRSCRSSSPHSRDHSVRQLRSNLDDDAAPSRVEQQHLDRDLTPLCASHLPIETERVQLRLIDHGDAAFVSGLFQDPDVRAFLGGPLASEVADERAAAMSRTEKVLIAVEKMSCMRLGQISFDDRSRGSLELSYAFLPAILGQRVRIRRSPGEPLLGPSDIRKRGASHDHPVRERTVMPATRPARSRGHRGVRRVRSAPTQLPTPLRRRSVTLTVRDRFGWSVHAS
jgi:hypothetical protein